MSVAGDRLVELRAFAVLEEAELAASLLEASGIESNVRERYAAGTRELTLALGGATVMVHERDLAAAREVLDADPRSIVFEPGDDEEATCAGCGEPLRNAMEPCPACNGQPDRRSPSSPWS